MKVKWELKTDKEAEEYVEEVDLSNFDFSSFTEESFEFQRKEAKVNMRIPKQLLAKIKAIAKARGIPIPIL